MIRDKGYYEDYMDLLKLWPHNKAYTFIRRSLSANLPLTEALAYYNLPNQALKLTKHYGIITL